MQCYAACLSWFCLFLFIYVFARFCLFVVLLESDGNEKETVHNRTESESNQEDNSQTQEKINSQSESERSQNNISADTVDTIPNQEHIHLENLQSDNHVTKLDNSAINSDIDSHSKNIITSTPNPKHRVHYDSMEEPDFEEDRIFGEFGTIYLHCVKIEGRMRIKKYYTSRYISSKNQNFSV